jgi:integrase
MAIAKRKLTDAVVRGAVLPEGKSEAVIWDTEVVGFGLRIRRGAKTYIVMYRPAGAGRSVPAKRFKIGTPGNIETAAEARKLARVILGQVAAGKDPAAERAELKRRERAKIGQLIDAYELDLQRRNYVDRPGTISTLRRNLKHLLNRDVAHVAASEFVTVRDRIIKDGFEGAADNFWSRCRAFLSWCVRQKVLETNPIIAHKAVKSTRSDRLDKEEEKGEVIPDDQLVEIWMAAGKENSAFGRYIQFLILSGCRRTEASKAARGMRAGSLLVLPKRLTKSGRDHNLPITPKMKDLLDKCEKDARSDLYFPSWKTGQAMQGFSKMLDRLRTASGVNFKLHDLRKTFRTGLDRLGVDVDIGAICINHSRRGLEAIYNQNSAPSEMRDAFIKWAKHIEGLERRKQPMFRRFPASPFIGPRKPQTMEDIELEERARQEDAEARDAYFDELEKAGLLDQQPPLPVEDTDYDPEDPFWR